MAPKRKLLNYIHLRPQTKNEHGRSMIEMLGILAVIGVLSVGALDGYSQAMTNYKANKAINEIHQIILNTKEFYSNQKDYSGLNNTIAKNAGIISDDASNAFGYSIVMSAHGNDTSLFVIDYYIPNTNACKKLLLAKWNTLGNELEYITTWNGSSGSTFYADGTGTYPLPVKIEDANTACTDDVTLIAFRIY
ncbi:MAG: hypothetical protein GY804_06285 [Alphaproteobacteria bacterium]|nr:hypothetical protein [Alphaproteobacteria bacterium]